MGLAHIAVPHVFSWILLWGHEMLFLPEFWNFLGKTKDPKIGHAIAKAQGFLNPGTATAFWSPPDLPDATGC